MTGKDDVPAAVGGLFQHGIDGTEGTGRAKLHLHKDVPFNATKPPVEIREGKQVRGAGIARTKIFHLFRRIAAG